MAHRSPSPKVFSGDIFGYLLVLGQCPIPRKNALRYYSCRCICGTVKSIRGHSLLSGNTKSCGCRKAQMNAESKRLPDEAAAVNSVRCSYRIKATKRGLPFLLSKDDVRCLITAGCRYCGMTASNSFKANGNEFRYNGIDRVNSDDGYTLDNSVSCCSSCNRAKMAMPRGDFLSWVARVTTHQQAVKVASITKGYFVAMVAYQSGSEAIVNPSTTRDDIVMLVRSREIKDIVFIHEITGSDVVDRTIEIMLIRFEHTSPKD